MLEQHVDAIRSGLAGGVFSNEASVSQGIVLRLLAALGWPNYDTRIVSPEYGLEGRRVDFALSHPAGHPKVFIEVKQVGQSDRAERQLFEYAFHAGIPMAILTDGREWNFFLPGEPGPYGDRRVYKLDLIERAVDESVRRLKRYLQYDAVCSGAYLANARSDYEDVARARQIRETLPQALEKLIVEEDELLLELVADCVESLCGYKPDPDTVAGFLAERVDVRSADPAPVAVGARVPTPDALETQARPATGGHPRSAGFDLLGQRTQCRTAREVLVSVIEALAARDPAFLERFVSLPRHGRRRRYIARDRADLYPGRSDLAEEHSHKLSSGYWVGINLSHKAVELCVL